MNNLIQVHFGLFQVIVDEKVSFLSSTLIMDSRRPWRIQNNLKSNDPKTRYRTRFYNPPKPKDDSPQSMPSIAETSMGSSQYMEDGALEEERLDNEEYSDCDDDDNNDMGIVKRLFQVENLGALSNAGTEVESNVLNASGLSTTSSETTVVASWNLSMKESLKSDSGASSSSGENKNKQSHPSEKDQDEQSKPEKQDDPVIPCTPLKQHELEDNAVPSTDKENHATHNRQSPHIIEEIPPEEEATGASCSGVLSLTPTQLANLFLAFQGNRKMWSSKFKDSVSEPDSSVDATDSTECVVEETVPKTISTTDRDKESLLRECTALKQIIEQDSIKIVNLKRAIDAQQELNALKEIEMEDKQIELQIALDRIDAIKKEKDIMLERQEELLETIQILKLEVDKLSTFCVSKRKKSRPSLFDEGDEEDEQLTLQDSFTSIQEKSFSTTVSALPDMGTNAHGDIVLMGDATRNIRNKACGSPFEAVDVQPSLQERYTPVSKDKSPSSQSTLPDHIFGKEQNLTSLGEVVLSPSNSIIQVDNEPVNGLKDSLMDIPENLPTPALAAMLLDITKRLEAVEHHEKLDATSILPEESEKEEAALDDIPQSPKLEKTTRINEFLRISEDPDEIEVVVPKVVEGMECLEPGLGLLSPCCCNAWDTLAGDCT